MRTGDELMETLVDIIIDKCEPTDTAGSLNEDTGEGHLAELYQYNDTWLVVEYHDDKEQSTFFTDEASARDSFSILVEKIKKEEEEE
jgi:hypothetical protein